MYVLQKQGIPVENFKQRLILSNSSCNKLPKILDNGQRILYFYKIEEQKYFAKKMTHGLMKFSRRF